LNLQQIHDIANQRSYFSRLDNEVWQAISSAAKKIYLWTARENRGYFFKDDNGANLSMQIGVQDIVCPPDLNILLKLGEQPAGSAPGTPWNWMRPADLNADIFILREFQNLLLNNFTPGSQFVFYGPYLTQASAAKQQGANPQGAKTVRLAPIPFDTRPVRFIYAATFLEVANQQSVLMMPPESHEAILDYAVAELVRPNGDMLAQQYEEAGMDKFQHDFLPFYRMQQNVQQLLTQEPYLEDLD